MRSITASTAVLLFLALPAEGALITDASDPLLTGASVITFDEVPEGTLDPMIAGITFSGIGGSVRTSFSEMSNSDGSGGIDGIDYDVTFSTPVAAFGSDFRAINRPVTLEVWNGAISLGSHTFDPGCCDSEFFGFGGFGVGITAARVSITARDLVPIDDFHFVPTGVPASGTSALFALALAGLIFQRALSIKTLSR